MAATVPISVIIPAWQRVDALRKTLGVVFACDPAPDEVLVHVDGGGEELLHLLQTDYPQVTVLSSSELLGPGGARNRLIAAAKHELVANFDDDSFPQHEDYFARVLDTAERFPEAAMLSAASQESEWREAVFLKAAVPSGCGCVFRKCWFAQTAGFVPLPIAYSMEEVDIGLQLHALGGVIVHDPFLRVKHEHPAAAKMDARVNAHVMANTALLPFLRYPCWLWPVGLWQIARRVLYCLLHGWTAGMGEGLGMIPSFLERHRHRRQPLSSMSVLSWLLLRHRRVSLGSTVALSTTRFT